MGRLSREAGGLGDYSENANDNEGLTEDEAAQVDELADQAEDQPELEPEDDEPA